jgi:hypothetical protein
MDPRREASERLGGRYEVRVLEPSPAAVNEPPYWADDPVHRGDVPSGRLLVSPVTDCDVTWDELARNDESLRAWCAERWLGAWTRLPEVPAGLGETRRSLVAVANHVLAAARYRATGKIGLRYTRGGFGTPFYSDDRQVRVAGTQLILNAEGRERAIELTTLRAAGEFLEIEPGAPDIYEAPVPLDLDAALTIDAEASRFVGEWFGFAYSVLEQLRVDSAANDPSRVQIWPEHFDAALEIGSEAAGARAGYGASTGDENHPEPYLYVVPWTKVKGDIWNDPHFFGATLSYAELAAVQDQRGAALAFYARCLTELIP